MPVVVLPLAQQMMFLEWAFGGGTCSWSWDYHEHGWWFWWPMLGDWWFVYPQLLWRVLNGVPGSALEARGRAGQVAYNKGKGKKGELRRGPYETSKGKEKKGDGQGGSGGTAAGKKGKFKRDAGGKGAESDANDGSAASFVSPETTSSESSHEGLGGATANSPLGSLAISFLGQGLGGTAADGKGNGDGLGQGLGGTADATGKGLGQGSGGTADVKGKGLGQGEEVPATPPRKSALRRPLPRPPS